MYIVCRSPASRFLRPRLGVLGSHLPLTRRCAGTQPNHTPDTYSKEVDTTPASDKKVNRIDPDTDAVQRPYEPPSGPWSQAGVETEEYRLVESGEGGKQPYTLPDSGKGRYGTGGDWPKEKGLDTSG